MMIRFELRLVFLGNLVMENYLFALVQAGKTVQITYQQTFSSHKRHATSCWLFIGLTKEEE